MQYALNKNKERIEPIPHIEATCPGCGEEVIAKCGSINVWHFAHQNGTDCDSWYEPESQWHREWKNNFPIENQEVTIKPHRADIETRDGTVIELQASSISADEIKEREQFYGKMIWIIKADDFINRFYIYYNQDGYFTFKWKHPRKCWLNSTKPIYLDFGSMLFHLKKMYDNGCGYGYSNISKTNLIKSYA